MPTSRRYVWTVKHPQPRTAAGRCQRVLADLPDWTTQGVRDAKVTGWAFGVLTVSLVLWTTDQWRVDKLARRLVRAMATACEVPVGSFELTSVERLEPHRHPNRGARWRVRRS